MIDLATLFQEANEELSGGSFPAFPVLGKGQPEPQVIGEKKISGVSGVSGGGKDGIDWIEGKIVQARAGAAAGERARDVPAEAPEMPETPEKREPAMRWLSGSSLGKPEKERETGNSSRLPAAPEPAPGPTFDERAAFLEYECGLSRSAAEAQAAREIRQAESAPRAIRPSVSALPCEDGLALWRAGVAALGSLTAPCPGYRGDEWSRVYARALDFLNTFGAQAEALGWTAPRLFGVHPVGGIVRVDCCGGLVLPGAGAVRAITATEISFGHLTHRKKPGQPQGVPLWDFGR